MTFDVAAALAKVEEDRRRAAQQTSSSGIAGSYDQYGHMVTETGGLRPPSHRDYVPPDQKSSRVTATPDRGGYSFTPTSGTGDRKPPPAPTSPSPSRGSLDIGTSSQMADFSRRQLEQMESMMRQAPSFDPSSPESLRGQAADWASMQVDPVLGALHRGYEEQQLGLENLRGRAEAAHAGYEADVDYALGQAEQQAIERAIARGGGRAGLSDWIVAELQKPIIGESQRIAAQHAQDIIHIAQQEVQLEKHYHDQIQELEQQRGLIESNKYEELKRYEDSMMRQDWAMAFEAQSKLTSLAMDADRFEQELNLAHAEFAEQRRQFDAELDYKIADWMWSAEEAEKDRVLLEAEIFGEMGGGLAPARQTVESMGGIIDWRRADDGGDVVIINGKEIHVQAVGGTNVGGNVQLPEDVILRAMYG